MYLSLFVSEGVCGVRSPRKCQVVRCRSYDVPILGLNTVKRHLEEEKFLNSYCVVVMELETPVAINNFLIFGGIMRMTGTMLLNYC